LKQLIFWIVLGLTNLSFGQDLKEIPKDFTLTTSECHTTLVNMISGKLIHEKDGTLTIKCTKKMDLNFICEFYGEKNELIDKKEMTVGIKGQQAVVSDAKETDVFLVSMMTRKLIGIANLNLQDGARIGKRICSGEFVYNDELEARTKKKKK
jgi:hypothetical protein